MNNGFHRMNSGIHGLDELIEGGFPYPSVILVAGPAGTGKTTLAQKFLFSGADRGEKGLYLTTLSEPPQWVFKYISRYKYINKKHFGTMVEYCDMADIMRTRNSGKILEFIDEKVGESMAQRVVIDPVTVLSSFLDEDYRLFLFDLVNRLKNWKAVSLLTGEVRPGEYYPSDVAYSADGAVLLSYVEEDGARRKHIEVLKMRGTNHHTGKLSFSITPSEGIVILSGKF